MSISKVEKNLFLARLGEIFGPFSRGEVEGFRESGKVEAFSWLWDPAVKRWMPVDPAPDAPPLSVREPGHSPVLTAREAREAPEARKPEPSTPAPSPSGIRAICHDHHAFALGTIESATDGGCVLVCADPVGAREYATHRPAFGAQAAIRLNLLAPEGRTLAVTGRIARVERRGKAWHYRVRWKRLPELLRTS